MRKDRINITKILQKNDKNVIIMSLKCKQEKTPKYL